MTWSREVLNTPSSHCRQMEIAGTQQLSESGSRCSTGPTLCPLVIKDLECYHYVITDYQKLHTAEVNSEMKSPTVNNNLWIKLLRVLPQLNRSTNTPKAPQSIEANNPTSANHGDKLSSLMSGYRTCFNLSAVGSCLTNLGSRPLRVCLHSN